MDVRVDGTCKMVANVDNPIVNGIVQLTLFGTLKVV
jgi:hypothetical protein